MTSPAAQSVLLTEPVFVTVTVMMVVMMMVIMIVEC